MQAFIAILCLASVAHCSWVGHHGAALVGPSSKGIVLVGPSASANLNGPDGSHISAHIPGAKVIAEPRHGGSVAGSIVPGHISHHGGWGGWDGGHHGAVILGVHGGWAGHGDDGQWVGDHNEAYYDDGSWRGDGHGHW